MFSFSAYYSKFTGVISKHFRNEFEVQIRDGKISSPGLEVLSTLSSEYHLLQIEDRIDEIVFGNAKKLRNKAQNISQLELLKHQVLQTFSSLISQKQKIVKRSQKIINYVGISVFLVPVYIISHL